MLHIAGEWDWIPIRRLPCDTTTSSWMHREHERSLVDDAEENSPIADDMRLCDLRRGHCGNTMVPAPAVSLSPTKRNELCSYLPRTMVDSRTLFILIAKGREGAHHDCKLKGCC